MGVVRPFLLGIWKAQAMAWLSILGMAVLVLQEGSFERSSRPGEIELLSRRQMNEEWQILFPHPKPASPLVAHPRPHLLSGLAAAAQQENASSSDVAEQQAAVGRDDKQERPWGYWRTPGHSNQVGTEPVANNDPLGDHIMFQSSDRLVNTSDVDKDGSFSPFTNIMQGNGPLPRMFSSADLVVPCSEEEGIDCHVVRASYPSVNQLCLRVCICLWCAFHCDMTGRDMDASKEDQKDVVLCSCMQFIARTQAFFWAVS